MTTKERLAEKYLPLVPQIAAKVSLGIPRNSLVDYDELCSAGYCGLGHAISCFKSGKSGNNDIYFRWHIRGSMLDLLRDVDVLSRSDRKKVCSIQQKQIVLEQELGRCATEAEVVAYCCLNPDDALLIDSDYVIQNTPNSLDDENWCELHRDKEPQALWVHPADHIANEEIREVLEQAISKLPPELHHVVNLIFTNSNLNCTI